VAGWLLRTLEPAGAPTRPGREQLATLAGAGSLPAVLGGMRTVVAGGFWLRANLAWERRDEAATVAFIELTVAADERPGYFWQNGARMIAYDLPEWLPATVPAPVRQREVEARACQALALLEKALRWRGPDPAVYVEMGNIHLRRRGDLEAAARCYRLAAEQPGAPYYAARIHAELLCAAGRPAEALAWLRQVWPALPADDPAARREAVRERIRALEVQLAAR
jgi:tetratricopeptide (TPR) repeat protein